MDGRNFLMNRPVMPATEPESVVVTCVGIRRSEWGIRRSTWICGAAAWARIRVGERGVGTATRAMLFDCPCSISVEPGLKPYHPNQRRKVPMACRGK